MLKKDDYDLLCFAKSMPYASKETLISRFGPGTSARISTLEHEHILNIPYISTHGHGMILAPGYAVTDKGYMLMKDYEYDKAFSLKRLWEDRVWKLTPIVISLIALVKSFWPEIVSLWQMLQ